MTGVLAPRASKEPLLLLLLRVLLTPQAKSRASQEPANNTPFQSQDLPTLGLARANEKEGQTRMECLRGEGKQVRGKAYWPSLLLNSRLMPPLYSVPLCLMLVKRHHVVAILA